MRTGLVAFVSLLLLFAAFLVVSPRAVEAHRCHTFKASHNGTDMFNPEGAVGTAKDKLLYAINAWKQKRASNGCALARSGPNAASGT